MLILNAFKMKKKLDEVKLRYYIYKVNNLRVVGEERYKILNDLAKKIRNKYHCIALRYMLSDYLNGIVIFDTLYNLGTKFIMDGYEFELVRQGEGLNIPNFRVKSFFYEILRAKLEYHGFWASAYNKYYRFSEDDIIDRKFRIFRGIFFRFEVLDDGSILLVLDPLTRIVSYDTVYELASRWGDVKAKNILKHRYVLALIVRRKELSRLLFKIHEFRPDLRAGVDEVIEMKGRKYTIREYYSEYLKLPEIADLIPEDAPIIELKPPNSNRILYIASSMVYLNYKTDEIPRNYVKEIMEKVYIKPEQRLTLTKSFLTSLNPLNYPYNEHIGHFEFEEEPVTFNKGKSYTFDSPRLKFKTDARTVDIDNYTIFFKKSLRELGVAKEISIPINNKLAIVYPENYITDNEAISFYKDIVMASRKVFSIPLPERPFLWGYRDDILPIVQNYNRFRSKVLAIIVILRSNKDELYGSYKKLFEDKVSQMATVRLIRLKEKSSKEESHIYRNAIINIVSGLLGKLGLRPWLLADKLKAHAYIGIDLLPGKTAALTLMDGYGNYLGERWTAQGGSKISSSDMYESLYQLVVENLDSLKVDNNFSIVFMKDGDIYDDELEGIRRFIRLMANKYSSVQYTVLSIRKNVPYRIYVYNNNEFVYPNIGSYIILGKKYGVLVSSGYPLIKNRLAKPLLIEVVEADPKKWYNIYDALQESYIMSFMHWATLVQKTKYPAPIKYANDLLIFVSKGIRVIGPPL